MSSTQQITLAEFITENGLTMTVEQRSENPNMADPMPGGSHWLCTIRHPLSHDGLVVPFSQGSAHRRWRTKGNPGLSTIDRMGTVAPPDIRTNRAPVRGAFERGESVDLRRYREECTEPTPPTLESVLDCLASDASSVECEGSFENWCSSLGYDTDSRKAEATYRACMEQAFNLRHLLGAAAYDQLLNHMERL